VRRKGRQTKGRRDANPTFQSITTCDRAGAAEEKTPVSSTVPGSGEERQREVIAFLSRVESYGAAARGAVERIDTHCSAVFLTGRHAYKLKRAIAFASLDYTTTERREAACRAEFTLNRRTAPDLYLRVRSINRSESGTLAFDGPGPAVDWVVAMRRFEQDDLFSRMAELGRLTPELIERLGDEIARFHGAAEVIKAAGGRGGIRRAIDENRRELRRFAAWLDPRRLDTLAARSTAALDSLADVLEQRRADGKVRRGHGDLRLANICLFMGRPTLFDCVEFSEDVGCVDVLLDLAFLLMDLIRVDLTALANVALNAYLDRTGEIGGLICLPLFLSVRAATRSFALAGKAERQTDPGARRRIRGMARAHLDSACSFLDPAPNCLVAVSGRPGPRRAWVTQGLAAELPPAPGARVIRVTDDRVAFTRLPATIDAVLSAGHSAVVDAPVLSLARRESIADAARRAGVPFVGFRLASPDDHAVPPSSPGWLEVNAAQGLPALRDAMSPTRRRVAAGPDARRGR
jgi:aminoglycoside phosphotransferase family enzyme